MVKKLFLKFIFFVLLLSSCTMLSLYAQDSDLRSRAELYFEGGEYEMAIPVLNELIEKNPADTQLYRKRGISYFHASQPEKAIPDLEKAIEKAGPSADLYYILGSAYDLLDKRLSAITSFRNSLHQDTSYAPASFRLAVLYMTPEGKQDSALYFAKDGIASDPGNPSGYYTLSMVYLNSSDYKSSTKAAKEGLEIDPRNAELLKAAGLGFYFMKNYEQSHIYFSRALKYDPGHEILFWKARSRLLFNSDKNEFSLDSLGNLSLTGISASHAENLDQMLSNRTGSWYYPALKRKFRNSLFEMSIKDFFMLYYGNSTEESFMDNYAETDSLYNLFNRNNYFLFEQNAEKLLNRDPGNFPLYYMLSVVYGESGQHDRQYEAFFKYYGFLNAILAGGNGKAPEKAFIVTDPEHEYEVISSLGLQLNNRKRIVENASCYDVVEAVDPSGDIILIYFYVEKACEKIRQLKSKLLD